jgi:hypothetical protein
MTLEDSDRARKVDATTGASLREETKNLFEKHCV